MGILDHRRSWHLGTRLSPEECAATFTNVLDGSGNAVPVDTAWRVKWRLRRFPTDGGAKVVATYDGRTGVTTSPDPDERPRDEGLSAIGSQITFEAVRAVPGGVTRCSMWLSRSCQVWFLFTADARFLRISMRRVAAALATADPEIEITKT